MSFFKQDYMDGRRIFTVDPAYFPLPRMREIVNYLHSHDQKYSWTSFSFVEPKTEVNMFFFSFND